MDIVTLDGRNYDVVIKEITENFNILYSDNTGRTLAIGAPMTLDPLGTFIGHKVTFKRRNGKDAEYDELYQYTYQPRYNGMKVKLVHLQDYLEYDAYVSQGERKLERVDPETGKKYWGEFSLNIVPMEAQVLPV